MAQQWDRQQWDRQQWDGQAQQPGAHGGFEPEPQGRNSAAAVIVLVLAAVLIALLAAIGYLVLRPGGISGDGAGRAAAGASSSSSSSPAPVAPPVTETAYTTAPPTETVTVTRPAPAPRSPGTVGGYPTGADSSGWVYDRQARCNAGDPAAMIGRTTQAAFSICINPDNGRYYYRGSSGGAGVEVDDPAVWGAGATVSNDDVVYSIDSTGMQIFQSGTLISSQPMVSFWAG